MRAQGMVVSVFLSVQGSERATLTHAQQGLQQSILMRLPQNESELRLVLLASGPTRESQSSWSSSPSHFFGTWMASYNFGVYIC